MNQIGGATLKASPSNTSKYIRKDKTNTSAVNYMLRSIGDASDTFNNTAQNRDPNRVYVDYVTSDGAHATYGTAFYGMAFPFGFCL